MELSNEVYDRDDAFISSPPKSYPKVLEFEGSKESHSHQFDR